ncbi:hypothetical protein V8J88_08265 [Massilia sp. W12]|uniref:hypothetical protein n=1 Tax=Massilia sp. W12 TaxID=3126507 RepID=UPI0030CD65F1
MKKILLALALPLSLMGAAQAADANTGALRPVLSVGVTYGGDTLATAKYTDGSSVNIRAGSGLDMKGGVEYRVAPQVSLQATVGYHVHFTPEASNGDANFNRIPIELLAFYHINEQWRVGGGVRFVRNARLSGSGAAANLNGNYGNTTGGVLAVEYMGAKNWGVSFRLVNEKYTLENSNASFSGNHAGLFASYYF